MKCELRINADDFGQDENATMAIMEAFRHHWITQTTLMVNMPWAERAVEMAKAEGYGSKIGLHLNLIGGQPLTNGIRNFSEFCDSSGLFNEGAVRNGRFWRDYPKAQRVALIQELEVQVQKYVSFGLPMLHCDSHCHSHFRLPILRLLLPILEKYGFKSVRRPYTIGVGMSAREILRRGRDVLLVSALRKAHLSFSDEFGGWESYMRCRDVLRGVVEIMVHPYYAHGQIVDIRDYDRNEGRRLEEITEVFQ